jgi:hypothetical protein
MLSHIKRRISSQIGPRSNCPQSNRPAPSQIGLKMNVKSATYFKLNNKLCIVMNSYFLLKDSCIILFFLMNRMKLIIGLNTVF